MVVEIPSALKVEGIKFVLLEKSGKKPFQKEWQNKVIEFNNKELIDHINNGGNYGVMGGGKQKLLIIDFDNEQLENEVVPKLLNTFTVKTGRGRLHKYYFTEKCDSFKIFDEQMNTLADIQGEGKQVVGPGSIHPNGNAYEVVDNRDIVFLPYGEIKALLMPYNKKPEAKDRVSEKQNIELSNEFLDKLKATLPMNTLLQHLGVDITKNPTNCLFHESSGGKCLGFNNETAHCFHCEGRWNIFSLIKQSKGLDFPGALQYLSRLVGLSEELEKSKKEYREKLNEGVKYQYISLITGKVKEWGKATELLVDYIKSKTFIYTTKSDIKREMFIYKDGIYISDGRSEVESMLRELLGGFYSQFVLNKVIEKIEPDTFIERDEFFSVNYPYEIPVLNGILNIKTLELSPFTPTKIFFNKINAEYREGATCPNIDKFLRDILSNEEDIDVFYEMVGSCLLKEYVYEKAFMLVGGGRNGKGKSLELIKRLMGPKNCSAVPLSSLIPESFSLSQIYSKMVNLAGDIGNRDLKDTSMFKSVTGRDLINGKRKFLNDISFINFAKMIFACNELPMVYDSSKGFWERWVLLEYPYTFISKEEYDSLDNKSNFKIRDPEIIDKITTPEEMSGFLNMSLLGLHRLFNKNNFSQTKGSTEIMNTWIRRSNSFMAFCMDKLEVDGESRISKKELRRRYIEYCKTHKLTPKSDVVIKITLQNEFGANERDQNEGVGNYQRVWEGIIWKKK